MQLMTFDEILTKMCDFFDEEISPRRIARTNTNIIYLVFKAISKGYEVINNICVSLSNKFNPALCSESDLESIADLVGTERLKGSASGLEIIVTNREEIPAQLLAGMYYYSLNEDTTFEFEVLDNMVLEPLQTLTFLAFSQKIGRYSVTAQSDIKINTGVILSPDIVFSCSDNKSLLGYEDETDLEFRNRIQIDTTRQSLLVELQTLLRNQPYIYDARIKFNDTLYPIVDDEGNTIPPYNMLIYFSGAPRNEIAELVASKSIFPTVKAQEDEEGYTVHYKNPAFLDENGYEVNLVSFKKKDYSIAIRYKYNATYIKTSYIEAEIIQALKLALNIHLHVDYITEADVFNILESMEIENVSFLNVDLLVDGQSVEYLDVPLSRIPNLVDVTFNREVI